MVLRTFGSIVFFELRHFKLGRYDHIRDQAKLFRVHTPEIVHTLDLFQLVVQETAPLLHVDVF